VEVPVRDTDRDVLSLFLVISLLNEVANDSYEPSADSSIHLGRSREICVVTDHDILSGLHCEVGQLRVRRAK